MKLSDREKRLLIIAAVMIVGGTFLFLMFGGESLPSSSAASTGESLEEEREKFQEYKDTIGRVEQINNRLKQIENFLPSGVSGYEAGQQLTKEIIGIYDIHGHPRPSLRPPRNRYIRGIFDYKFLEIATDFSLPYEKTCALLDAFDRYGFFIEDLSINSTRDKDRCVVQVTLVKLVKVSDLEKRRRERLKQRVHGGFGEQI